MRLFVTGATGFVGINFVKKVMGVHEVVALVRRVDKALEHFGDEVEAVEGTLGDLDSLVDGMKGCDMCVHIAGLVSSYREEDFYEVNRFGSANVARAASEVGVRRIVYVSSIAARGPNEVLHPISAYGFSKFLGELEFLRYRTYELAFLRPCVIYGPYDRALLPLFRFAKKYRVLPFVKGKMFSLVHVQDVIRAIETLVGSRDFRSRVYYISDGECYPWKKLMKGIFNVLGIKGAVVPVSSRLSEVVFSALKELGFNQMLNEDKFREFKGTVWCCGFEGLHEDFDFVPDYDMNAGFEDTVRWYEENGWI